MRMAKSKLTAAEQFATLASVGGLPPRELIRRTWLGMDENNLWGRAAELAFNFILAIFPFLICLLTLFGLFASKGSALEGDLLGYLSKLLPPSGFQVVLHTLVEVAKNATGGKLTFGIILMFWFASGGITSIVSGLNAVYRINESRSWLKVRATAVLLTVVLTILFTAALVLVLGGSYLARALGAHYGFHHIAIIGWSAGQALVALVCVALGFSLMYYYAPDLDEQHWYWITPGSIFGVLLWIAASLGFRAYLHFFNTFNLTYGSLGAAMILLIWLYISGLAFLIGGEINAQIEHAAAGYGHPEAKAPGEKRAA